MKYEKGFIQIYMLFGIVGFITTWGWIWNVIKLVESTFDPITVLVIARIVGIVFIPLGVVLGFY